jgi:hypothetical protein
LLGLAVRTNGISLGRTEELILDVPSRRAVGVDVLCGDGVHRFLPLAAASMGEGAIAVDSALMLLDEPELRFYRERGTPLSQARGSTVERGGEALGTLRDVVLGDDLALAALLVDGAQPELVPLDDAIRLGDGRRRAPAA